MKANPEAVRRWKQANMARVLEMNRKWYHKNKHKLRTLKGTAPQAHLKKQMCACGNVAFKPTSSGYICERCSKIEIWNEKHENNSNTTTIHPSPDCFYVSRGVSRSWEWSGSHDDQSEGRVLGWEV